MVRGGIRLDLTSRPTRDDLGVPEAARSRLIALPRRAPFTVRLVLPEIGVLARRAISLHTSCEGASGPPAHLRLVMTSMTPSEVAAALVEDGRTLGLPERDLANLVADLLGALPVDGQVTRSLRTPRQQDAPRVELTGTLRPARDGNEARSNVSWGVDLRTLQR